MAKTTWKSIRVDAAEEQRLVALAKRNERTLAAEIRLAIRERLEREETKA